MLRHRCNVTTKGNIINIQRNSLITEAIIIKRKMIIIVVTIFIFVLIPSYELFADNTSVSVDSSASLNKKL